MHVDEVIVARLVALQEEFRRAGAMVAWARPAGMHLTLKFLGNVEETKVPAIGEALDAVAATHGAFLARIAGLGAFPNFDRPHAIWAGVQEGHGELAVLAGAVEDALTALDFPRDPRAFSPHLTIGRVKGQERLDALTAMLPAHEDDEFGEMTVREVLLFRSDLLPQGAKYTVLRRCPLGG